MFRGFGKICGGDKEETTGRNRLPEILKRKNLKEPQHKS